MVGLGKYCMSSYGEIGLRCWLINPPPGGATYGLSRNWEAIQGNMSVGKVCLQHTN